MIEALIAMALAAGIGLAHKEEGRAQQRRLAAWNKAEEIAEAWHRGDNSVYREWKRAKRKRQAIHKH